MQCLRSKNLFCRLSMGNACSSAWSNHLYSLLPDISAFTAVSLTFCFLLLNLWDAFGLESFSRDATSMAARLSSGQWWLCSHLNLPHIHHRWVWSWSEGRREDTFSCMCSFGWGSPLGLRTCVSRNPCVTPVSAPHGQPGLVWTQSLFHGANLNGLPHLSSAGWPWLIRWPGNKCHPSSIKLSGHNAYWVLTWYQEDCWFT